jgi:hypothetical protein
VYDIPLTWARWAGEIVGEGLVGGGVAYKGVALRKAEIRRELTESRTGLVTPNRFWRCAACRHHGALFPEVAAKKKRGRIEDRTRPPADQG